MMVVGCQSEGQVVATVNNKPVMVKEARFYLALAEVEFESTGGEDIWETPFDGRSAEEVAKERAIESVVKAKILGQKAEKENLVLNEAQEAQVQSQAEVIIANIGEEKLQSIGVTNEDVETLLKESYLGSLVLYSLDVNLDEEEIKKEVHDLMEAYMEQNKEAIVKQISIPRVDNQGELLMDEDMLKADKLARDIYIAADSTQSYEDILKTYKVEGTILRIARNHEELSSLLDQDEGYIMKIDHEKSYDVYILDKTIDMDQAVLEQMSASLEQDLRTGKEKEAYANQYEDWKLNAVIDINEDVWDTIKIK